MAVTPVVSKQNINDNTPINVHPSLLRTKDVGQACEPIFYNLLTFNIEKNRI
jgi:hypothetical protein